MSKFKIGDKVHHMESNKPVTNEIKSVVTIQGSVELGYSTFKSGEKETLVIYGYGYKSFVPEKDVFGTIEELKNALFNPILKKE